MDSRNFPFFDRDMTIPSTDAQLIWKGRPSLWLNAPTNSLLLILCALIGIASYEVAWFLLLLLPVLISFLWHTLLLRSLVYEINTQRIRVQQGVFSQTINDLELYRIKDINVVRPFWLRLVGLSTLVVHSSDRTHPVLRIEAIRDGLVLRDQIRDLVEDLRDKKRVRELDFNSDHADSLDDDHFSDT